MNTYKTRQSGMSRVLAWALTLMLAAGMFAAVPLTASAASNAGTMPDGDSQAPAIPYLDEDGEARERPAAILTEDTTALFSGWYVAQGELVFPERLTVVGDVHIILADGCHLNAENGGIGISSTGNSLAIYAQSSGAHMGRLTAIASGDDAGIGDDGNGVTVVINGGNVNAVGPVGAGIGGGYFKFGADIIINGGIVTASGGAGDSGLDGSGGRSVTLNGGTVTAIGGSAGAISLDSTFTITAPDYTYWTNGAREDPGDSGFHYPEDGDYPYAHAHRLGFVKIDITRSLTAVTGTLYQYSGSGAKTPLSNVSLKLYDKSLSFLDTAETDQDGNFSYAGDIGTLSNLYVTTDNEFGRLMLSGETGLHTGQMYRLITGHNSLTYLPGGQDYTNGYRIAGHVLDSGGNPVAGASISYLNELAASGTDGSFSFLIDADWLKYHSPSFSVSKDGYQSGSFYADTISPSSVFSMLQNGYIDVGDIRLWATATDSPFTLGSVSVWKQMAQRGESVQVTVSYGSDQDISDAVLTVKLPAGASFVSGSASNPAAVADGNALTLDEPIQAGSSKTLLFWVRANEDYAGKDFTVEAFAGPANEPGRWRIGGGVVILTGMTLSVPTELSLDDNGDALPFTLRVDAPTLDGYTMRITLADPDGEPADLNKTAAQLSPTGAFGYYQLSGIRILDAAGNPGIYTVTASLIAPDGETADSAEAEIYIASNAVATTALRTWSSYFDLSAPRPVTESSYVAACLYADTGNRNRDPVYVRVEADGVGDVTDARFVAISTAGFFVATSSQSVSIDASGHGVFEGYFAPGSMAGTIIKVGLQLSWQGAGLSAPGPGRDSGSAYWDAPKYKFYYTLIQDPSGYVFDSQTDERVRGATATLQALTGDGLWADWDAENYYQSNPQTTDEDGAYGWFVPEGQYRVLVRAEGYEDYSTDLDEAYGVIVVLPPRDDIFIGLKAIADPPAGGDLDGNGQVTVADALLAATAVLGSGNLSDAQKQAADIDGDGHITMKDVILIARKAAGF
ncbi:MAG: dockerin type I domain-containing protein [Clostridiales Family XIII bacterium]|jgi:hypothetical protein|nr:dockerin type I domain-containing protein [Clostridiales Family XIII bacterium]